MSRRSDDVPVDLVALADELLDQAAAAPAHRAARTLPHPVEGLRQTVIALSDGAQLHEHNSPGPAAIIVLRGHARLIADDDTVDLERNDYAPVPPSRHSVHAVGDTVLLLTVALTVA